VGGAVGEWIVGPDPRDDAGGLVPPVVGLLIFGALVFLLLVMVFVWVRSQVPSKL